MIKTRLQLWGNKHFKFTVMSSSPFFNGSTNSATAETSRALRSLYFTRAAFSIIWVVLVSIFSKDSPEFGKVLLVIYPIWDVFGTLLDIRANKNNTTATPQYINAVISLITAVAVGIALQTGVSEALRVFGCWAVLTGIIQLLMGLIRRKSIGGQWPMIISGGQSVIAGISFIVLASAPTMGIASLAGYAAFGAFYYLLSAFRIPKTAESVIS
ncbi:hypothetical protein SAMN04487995_3059 [Dyadobacter koreensis]|uniref:DUF308 domain-containing protein n=2 Tax=Dyadobacter koreensis TaxID=408657 RepID=A0A1H6VMI8_9BACT|nr:hypothetical protein SAMN04487995_3059 [Dyadobacter koreensis]